MAGLNVEKLVHENGTLCASIEILAGQHRFIYRSSRDNTSELEAHVTECPQAKTSRPDNRKLK